MEISIRTIGNSKGVLLPRPLLAQAGLDDQMTAEITLQEGMIILRKVQAPPRLGWAEAASELQAKGGGEMLMGEFGNQDDAGLVW